MHPRQTATQHLIESLAGDESAHARLLELVYADLHEIAVQRMRNERAGHTLQPTALVHEAFLRLIEQQHVDHLSKQHFLALAATAMRRVLIDHARSRKSQKRGRGAAKATLDEDLAATWDDPVRMLEIDEALSRLATSNPRQARVVELRFFGGLGLEEAADVLGVSRDTVKLDWRFARAWLQNELGDEERQR